MTDLGQLWLATLQDVAGRAAHEVRDSLNGVALNLEVVRARAAKRDGTAAADLSRFASDAAAQLETLTERADALLFLARAPKGTTADVALVLRHLAALLVAAAKADQITLDVQAAEVPVETTVPELAVRVALAAGLLALIKEGGGKCRLDVRPDTVVRFSHESAAIRLDRDASAVLAEHGIGQARDESALILTFPASKTI